MRTITENLPAIIAAFDAAVPSIMAFAMIFSLMAVAGIRSVRGMVLTICEAGASCAPGVARPTEEQLARDWASRHCISVLWDEHAVEKKSRRRLEAALRRFDGDR